MSVVLYSTCSPILPGCTLTDGYGGFMPDGYYSNGVNWVIVSGGLGVITSYGSCTPPPTTTTTSTTTSTTLAYNSFLLAYSATDGATACGNYPTLFTNTYFTDPGINYLATGVTIFQDSALTSPAGNGFYSNGTYYWNTGAGAGNLQNQTLCPGATTTSTTTTTLAPLTAHTLYYSSVSAADACSTTNSITVYTNCNPIVGECELWYDAAGTVVAGEYFYSDHAIDTVYEMYVTHFFGTGVVATVSSCTTTTTTTTTTINPNGDFILDPQYGINITALATATGTLPAFTYPRNSGSSQTKTMVSSYSASNQFAITLSGTRMFGTNKTIQVYVNSVPVIGACAVISADGAQTKILTVSSAISITDDVAIRIDSSGTCVI